jgi:hypothetical protein
MIVSFVVDRRYLWGSMMWTFDHASEKWIIRGHSSAAMISFKQFMKQQRS